jgi:phage gp29-like protein
MPIVQGAPQATVTPLQVIRRVGIGEDPGTGRRIARELPILSWTDWDNVQQVKEAVRGLEQGRFAEASQVIDAMGRDDRIEGVLLTRTGALPSLPLSFKAYGDGRRKETVVNALEAVWDKMLPDSTLAELMHWGVMAGAALGQLLWTYLASEWRFTLKVWHPRFLWWRWDTRSLWVSTMDGPVEVKPGDGQWLLYTPQGLDRCWMRGKVRSLYVPWLIRQWGMRDWARNSETNGMGIRKAVIPSNTPKEEVDKFMQEVAALGSESVISTPYAGGGAEQQRFDVELLEAAAHHGEDFDRLINMANTSVSINLLGQNLTTEVKGGSYAATMGHLAIRGDVLQKDGETLAQCLREQALRLWAAVNFGDPEVAPLPAWETKPPDDKVQVGQGLKNVGEGITQLRSAGVQVDADKVTEALGIPTTGAAEVVEPQPVEEGPADEPRPDLQRPRIARQSTGGEELPDSAVEGQLYVDELSAEGTAAAQRVLRPDLEALLSIVERAKDADELRELLVKHYRGMRSKELAKLVKHTLLLAEMAGRWAVTEEATEDDDDAGDDDSP